MDPSLFILAAGLGLLGFIEPCTIGAHMIFVRALDDRTQAQKLSATAAFAFGRCMTAGLFGLMFALLGQEMIGIQTSLWIGFGTIYVLIGVHLLADFANPLRRTISFVPESWKRRRQPLVMGLVFGLNIPACAAPLLLGLLGVAAIGQAMSTGFIIMAVFGLFLSAPIFVLIFVPEASHHLSMLGQKIGQSRRFVGLLFVAVGIWAIWFAITADPANWVSQST